MFLFYSLYIAAFAHLPVSAMKKTLGFLPSTGIHDFDFSTQRNSRKTTQLYLVIQKFEIQTFNLFVSKFSCMRQAVKGKKG